MSTLSQSWQNDPIVFSNTSRLTPANML